MKSYWFARYRKSLDYSKLFATACFHTLLHRCCHVIKKQQQRTCQYCAAEMQPCSVPSASLVQSHGETHSRAVEIKKRWLDYRRRHHHHLCCCCCYCYKANPKPLERMRNCNNCSLGHGWTAHAMITKPNHDDDLFKISLCCHRDGAPFRDMTNCLA